MRLLPVLAASTVLSLGLAVVSAGDARAQATPAAPAATPTSPPPAATDGTAAAAPAAGAPATAPGADKPADGAADDKDHDRLRVGFNFLNVGIGSGGGLSGPMIGATFKIGWQFNRLMGAYGNISPFVWIGSSDKEVPGVSLGAIAGTQFTPLFSLTPADIFEVAAGPSLDYLSGGSTSATVGNAAGNATVSAGGFSGVYFGAHGKLALHLGGRNATTGRRHGFTIEGNIHPSFTPGSAVVFMSGGLGYDWL